MDNRPLGMWMEKVTKDGRTFPRFGRISDPAVNKSIICDSIKFEPLFLLLIMLGKQGRASESLLYGSILRRTIYLFRWYM